MYYKILGRIFVGIFEQKRLKAWLFMGALLFALSFCMVFKPSMAPLPLGNVKFRWSMGINFNPVEILNSHNTTGKIDTLKKSESLLQLQRSSICNFTGKKSDYCLINGDIRIHGNSSSIYFTTPRLNITTLDNTTFGGTIKIHARKTDSYIMRQATPYKLIKLAPSSRQQLPECTVKYTDIPAVVFAAGGYTGNIFHDISDVMVPLYLTSYQFNGQVQFLLESNDKSWVEKYRTMFRSLSKYKIIDLARDDEIRCFKSAIIGLKSHDEFIIDPQMSPFGLTMRNFTRFVRQTYSLQQQQTLRKTRPRLLIISRKKTRVILNEDDVALEAKRLGYDVGITDPDVIELEEFSKTVNSFDVMVGVHGAGLTNMIFLPENAVLIQVVPLQVEPFARFDYERPARSMNLRYLEYKIERNESSLIDEYPSDDPVFVEHDLFEKKGWMEFKKIYLDKQNVRVDVNRFRHVLLEALRLLRQ